MRVGSCNEIGGHIWSLAFRHNVDGDTVHIEQELHGLADGVEAYESIESAVCLYRVGKFFKGVIGYVLCRQQSMCHTIHRSLGAQLHFYALCEVFGIRSTHKVCDLVGLTFLEMQRGRNEPVVEGCVIPPVATDSLKLLRPGPDAVVVVDIDDCELAQ